MPPLTLLAPAAARAMLDFRRRTLRSAMNGAALAGRRGALYPWEACPLHGEEVTPGARPGLQDHVSLDVALTFEAYVHATGDLDEARAMAWPVMRAVAECYGAFIDSPWDEPDEFPVDASDRPRAAPMFAHIGGFLSGLLFGYPGVRMHGGDPESWAERPVVLPDGWRSIHAAELCIRGARGSLTATHGADRADISIT